MHKHVGLLAMVAAIGILFMSVDQYAGSPVTGMGTGTLDVSVNSSEILEMEVLVAESFIGVGERENITVNIRNRGSTTDSSQLEVAVMTFNGSLKTEALYFDSIRTYYPGYDSKYEAFFIVPREDLYFVRARLQFGSNVYEAWNVFSSITPPPPNVTPTDPPPSDDSPSSGGGGGSGPSIPRTITVNGTRYIGVPGGTPILNASAPEITTVAQGDSVIIPIKVENIGEIALTNIKPFFSVPAEFEFSVSPPFVNRLSLEHDLSEGSRAVFLVTFRVPLDTPTGEYDVLFEMNSDQDSDQGSFTLYVVSPDLLNKEEFDKRITSYELIAIDLEQQIESAHRRGIDVRPANASLNTAKEGLERSKMFLAEDDLQNTKEELEKVREDLERTALQIATANFFVVRPLDINQIIIIVFTLSMISGFMAFLMYRKKREKERPKLLKKATSGEKENK